jgi:CRP/FNR family transcriptional regulator
MAGEDSSFVQFLSRHSTKRYVRGEIIIFQGEAPRTAYIIKQGIVKSYNLSVQGDEKPVGFFTKNDVFPSPWTFGKAPNAYYYYEAFNDVEVYCVPREEYIEYLQAHPQYTFGVLEKLVLDQLGSTMRLNALQHSRASDKLLYTLHYLTLTHGRSLPNRVVEITLALTHQDFANLTGLTRETAATELNKLKTKGVINYGKQTLYKVQLDKLQQVINDQFIADVQVSLR